jgi:hypothetical protein
MRLIGVVALVACGGAVSAAAVSSGSATGDQALTTSDSATAEQRAAQRKEGRIEARREERIEQRKEAREAARGASEGGSSSGGSNKNYIQKNGCTPPDPRGYLMWTGYLVEFNNQLITLAETILLNKQLNRKLVLTGFSELKDPGPSMNASNGIDYQLYPKRHILHPTSFALDIKETMAGLNYTEDDWTTPKDLAKVCEMEAAAHAFIHYFELPTTNPLGKGRSRRTHHRSPYYVQEKIWQGKGVPDESFAIPELKKMGLKFSKAEVTVHDSTDIIEMSELPSGQEKPMLIMDYLFYSNNNFNPSYAPLVGNEGGTYDFFATIGKMKWSREVIGTRDNFVNNHLGGGSARYMAVHWRRGFHVASAGANHESSADISYDRDLIVDGIIYRMQNGCADCPAYIASNNITQDDVNYMKHAVSEKMGKKPTITSLMLNPPNVDMSTLSRAEMAICTNAYIFAPSVGSTWSANVMAMRGMKVGGPPTSTDPSPKAMKEFLLAKPKDQARSHGILSSPSWGVPDRVDAAAVAMRIDEANAARKVPT